MVLKKPYAFLIKHFRLIHLLLTASLAFIFYNLSNIRSVFNTLSSTKTYTYAEANSYFNNAVFSVVIIGFLLSFVLLYLLKVKKKPVIPYFLSVLYYLASFIIFIYLKSTLNTLSVDLLTDDNIRLVRDLTMLFTIPIYPLSILFIIRSIGLNLKQFNFSKDVKELEISEEDSEEYEITLGKNRYKYARLFRRLVRETKYYFLENKFALYLVLMTFIIVGSSIGIYSYNKNMSKVGQNTVTVVDNMFITVNDSYVSEYNSNGKIIKNGSKFVIVDLSIRNFLPSTISVDLNKLTLSNGQLVYYPTTAFNQSFYDLGIPVSKNDVYEFDKIYNKLIIFEIPSSVKTNGLIFRLEYGLTDIGTNVISNYTNFRLNPKNLDSSFTEITSELGKNNMVEYFGNKFEFNIKSYSVQDSYNNKYVLCKNLNDCSIVSSIISSDNIINYAMIVVSYDALIYDDSRYLVNYNSYDKIFQNYLSLSYSGTNYSINDSVKVLANQNVDGKLFLLVDRRAASASGLTLNFDYRNNTIAIPLK